MEGFNQHRPSSVSKGFQRQEIGAAGAPKKFVAWARVSSREQEREGFSLQHQVDALRAFAAKSGGEIVKLYQVAETATRSDERKHFKDFLAFCKKHASGIDGVLAYKIDRMARSMFDSVELERLESDYGVGLISVSQPMENTPSGKLMRRTLQSFAVFQVDQQSCDVKDGLARRVRDGFFVGKARYGYKNVRLEGRGLVVVEPREAENVRRLFQWYAFDNLTLDMLVARTATAGMVFRDASPRFNRSTVHELLTDRCYLGEVPFRGNWYPAQHEPLVDKATWDRVQALLGGSTYKAHDLTYAGEFMRCGHCQHPITGERKVKRTKQGERSYVYYRCSRYNQPGHPRVRVTEAEVDRQVFDLFERIRIQDENVREWFRTVLRSVVQDGQQDVLSQQRELSRQVSLITAQQDRLLNLRLDEQITEDAFARKATELRDRLASTQLQLDVLGRSHDESAETALKVFELSQTLKNKWFSADLPTKRQILEIVCLNCTLDGVSLCPTMRKPFDVLLQQASNGLSRDGRI